MSRNEFEAIYREVSDAQLDELSAQMEDLVPEARVALAEELRRRGRNPAGGSPDQQARQAPAGGKAGRGQADGSGCAARVVAAPLSDEVLSGNWVSIPSFVCNDAPMLAACMEAVGIPFQLKRGDGSCQGVLTLAVPEDRFPDCVAALKEQYELLDEEPEPFTGDCPACGAKLAGVAVCPDCDLSFARNGWDAMSRHPFVRFLEERGLGRRCGDSVIGDR